MTRTKTSSSQSYYGHGKLLLSSEYLVLDGAKALALPTTVGQTLNVKYRPSYTPTLHWKSKDHIGNTWFEGKFEFWHFKILESTSDTHAQFITKILEQARQQNYHFLREENDVFVETTLEFPLEWGLGSSSTLIYNIAQWAYISPFQLLFETIGGSGYDIASAQSLAPVIYQNTIKGPKWAMIDFRPPFQDNLYFVYLNRKQKTSEAIEAYQSKLQGPASAHLVDQASLLTEQISTCQHLDQFEELINHHEKLISSILEVTPVQKTKFPDYWGQIKSLGAWGGDFVLATSSRPFNETKDYFMSKDLDVVIPFSELVLSKKEL